MSTGNELHVLPPQQHSARGFALSILCLAPLLLGFVALVLGQDANWDLRNYHWYNAYALLTGRYAVDLLPSQTPWFYNPVLDVPFYLLATHVPARLAGFILGAVQGLNFVLLFMLAHVSLVIANPRHKVLVCTALGALGMLGGGGLALLGTTFYDNVTSLGLFTSALLVLRHADRLLTRPLREALPLALLFGIPSGLMMGLKLPCVIFCLGLCFSFLLSSGSLQRRVLLAFAFGCGVLLGASLTLGPWAYFLDLHFGSPLFPYFNQYFQSPLAPLTSARDTGFVTHSWQEAVFFPFIFAAHPQRVGEIPWRDWRITIFYVLLPLAVLLQLFFGRTKNRADTLVTSFASRYLLWTGVIAYGAWLAIFCIYRYLIPLEMMTPLLIVMAVGLLPLKKSTRGLLAAFLLLVIAASVQPGNWYRRATWTDPFVAAELPPLGPTEDLMILMAGFEPYAHLITTFPPEIPFVRIQSNFASPNENKGINQVIHARIEGHKGRFLLLIPPWQMDLAAASLSFYSLTIVPQSCQIVTDRLYDDKQMSLCRLKRLTQP